jgi:hypothetical protein
MDAIGFLKGRMKVWCRSRVRWERENLYLLPSGDFTDGQGRLHRREGHTAYVTLEDAISAIRMVEEKFLSDKETELQRLKSEDYTFIKRQEIAALARKLFLFGYVGNPINVSFDEIDGMNNDTKILCDYKLGNITLEEAIKRLNDSKNE